MFSVPSQPGENRGERLREFERRSVKTRDAVACFIYFIKLLFSILTNRKTIYEACTVNSYNSETVKPHCTGHFRASQRYENTLLDQSKPTYYPNYFIIVFEVFNFCTFIKINYIFLSCYKQYILVVAVSKQNAARILFIKTHERTLPSP